MDKYFAILNSESNSLMAVAARWAKNGDYLLEGFCRGASRGLRKGIVKDVVAATDSIHAVLNDLKETSGRKFSDVYANISSSSVRVASSEGIVALSKYGREVSENDIKKCVQIGSTVKVPLDKEALHYIVNGFSVDGEDPVKNPLNMEGVKLSARLNIITINSSAVNNLAKCIAQAGFSPAGFVFSGLAASYRVLDAEDKEEGVVLLDIGEDVTEALIFFRGILNGCRVFPVGINSFLSQNENVNKDSINDLALRVASLSGWGNVRKIIVTDADAMTDDVIEELERSFKRPTRIGTFLVKPFEELPPERMRYMGNIGMLDYLRENRLKERRCGTLARRVFNKILAFIDRYF
jgi:cell division protein FtsA